MSFFIILKVFCYFLFVIDRENSAFFKRKPTFRKLTSQHPYADRYIGKPHVYTVNIKNLNEVEAAIIDLKNKTVSELPQIFHM